ncbi:MAG: membrane protein insertion efficiency factor YidD [Verrucomicrobia bacterium]|nr:membrane protein insertion efficiency factor YidD [Verrucomicrobiota bacterium]
MGTLLIAMIRLQKAGAPFWRALLGGGGPCCRFHPTCSAYAIEAIQTHGAGRGLLLSLRRLTRCHPWGGAGFDPVKETA